MFDGAALFLTVIAPLPAASYWGCFILLLNVIFDLHFIYFPMKCVLICNVEALT